MDTAKLLLEAFRAAGADDGLVYVSVPITSGPREVKLLAELRCTREELRSEHRDKWLTKVVEPNERDAIMYAARVRALFPQQLVVEPARLHVSEWSQDDYGRFWESLIRTFALRLVATPDWASSVGSRQEIRVALEIGLPILDIRGHSLGHDELAQADTRAQESARALGLSDEEIGRYFPPLNLPVSTTKPTSDEVSEARRESEANLAVSEVFAWLRGERALQLTAFGPERDDEHTRKDGLAEDGWWSKRLNKYMQRARVLGVDAEEGREALAKLVATSMALLESVVRLYGWLPAPGTRLSETAES